MPLALVELIADGHSPGIAAISDTPPKIEAFLQTARRGAEQARHRRVRTLAAIMLAAVVNIAASIASAIWHVAALGAAATIGSWLLAIAVLLLARRATNRRRTSSRPPR